MKFRGCTITANQRVCGSVILMAILLNAMGFPRQLAPYVRLIRRNTTVNAEVIGFQNNHDLLSVHDHDAQISVGARVVVTDDGHSIKVGPELLGRAIDALGHPLDNGPPLRLSWPLNGKTNPLARRPVDKQLDVGVRVINSLLTVGQGQRIDYCWVRCWQIGLLGMMTRFTAADVGWSG